MGIWETIFGDANKKYLIGLQPLIDKINAMEVDFEKIETAELKSKTGELKERLQKGETLDDILPEAFALAREASKRTLKQRHYDVQLLGGIALHKGQIAEMRTGEGKTLTATLAVCLNALSGLGVHLITVNDYLARRDVVWMGQIYALLGLSVGCIQHESAFVYDAQYHAPELTEKERDRGIVVNENYLRPVSRKEAYMADITYGTNNEFGFDHLRDNMAQNSSQKVMRELSFAIIDEVDSILIDEARTPLIISAPDAESADYYSQFARLVKNLRENDDYNIDEKLRAATLTESGIEKMEKALGVSNIYEAGGVKLVHHLESALRAETLFKLDKDYVVKNGEVIIVDEFTGRLMHGRRYSEGLHQAIEAKEGVKVQRESVTMATITFQNYFRLYKKLSGMTGTAATESEEFSKIYHLDVTIIPTNKLMIRKDLNDLIYKTEAGKFKAVINEIKKRQQAGQPVLVGTISIEKNEVLSELLSREGVRHEILNAKNHEREAQIIAQAGKFGAVTLATNMAGRGVDIILGGNPSSPEEAEKVKMLGGLHIIGTERHESRRIDNQLRGRAGRQGDPGSSQFFVSLDDDLMRIFGSERIKSIMTALRVPEDMPIENKLITKSLESAQKKVEGNNFDIRKHLVEYDDVLNKHRETIYKKRQIILDLTDGGKNGKYNSLKDLIWEMIEAEIGNLLEYHFAADGLKPDFKEILETLKALCGLNNEEAEKIQTFSEQDELKLWLLEILRSKYGHMEKIASENLPALENGQNPLRMIEKNLLLQIIDSLWVNHLSGIDYLRTGIGLQGYGQRDPLVEYKREAFTMFKRLLSSIQSEVVAAIFRIGQASWHEPAREQQNRNLQFFGAEKTQQSKGSVFNRMRGNREQVESAVASSKLKDEAGKKIGRNDPCVCGSGLKYKKCCGK